jgi:2,5-diamino-6-(ribosylamino)-4(3H)-pyrimidinone 5'-phosphate reductase
MAQGDTSMLHKDDTGRDAGRPRVICHMMASLDGRIVTDGWPLSAEERAEYERVHESYEADGWLVGRVTLERHFATGVRPDEEIAREHDGSVRDDFIAPGRHETFAFAVDPRGRLTWTSGDVDGDHLVVLLTERVSDEYLSTLRAVGVSYLLAGREELDLPALLAKIGVRLGVRTLMLEGGGGINGSMLRAGLVDEVSVLLAPVADGRVGTAALFDVIGEGFHPRRLGLEAVERRAGDVLWLRYRVGETQG